MNLYIATFLLAGALFGLFSYSNRHLFSEGPHKADAPSAQNDFGPRLYWGLVCTFLWPILLLTGLNSLVILSRRKSFPSDESVSK